MLNFTDLQILINHSFPFYYVMNYRGLHLAKLILSQENLCIFTAHAIIHFAGKKRSWNQLVFAGYLFRV